MDNRVVGTGHYENFPVASWLCPPELRDAIRSIYAFARTADDIADEGDAPAELRLATLGRYRQALRNAASPSPTASASEWPQVFGALARQIRQHELPVNQLHALLDAFEQDTRNPPYATRDELLDYCSRSANPIGRLLLHLYGIHDADALRASDAICSALQLINFWQDLSVDLPRGRIYLPQTDCERFGIAAEQLIDPSCEAQACAMVADLSQWAARVMTSGATLPRRVPGRAGWELRAVMHGGWRILEKIADMKFRSFAARPRITAADALPIAWRTVWFSPEQFRPAALA